MEKNNQYTTLTSALEDLNKKGYSGNFSVTDKGLLNDGKGILYPPVEAKLMEFHRFEGLTNPSDSSILYVVKLRNGLKGTVVDSYGAQGSETTSKFMDNVKQKQFN